MSVLSKIYFTCAATSNHFVYFQLFEVNYYLLIIGDAFLEFFEF